MNQSIWNTHTYLLAAMAMAVAACTAVPGNTVPPPAGAAPTAPPTAAVEPALPAEPIAAAPQLETTPLVEAHGVVALPAAPQAPAAKAAQPVAAPARKAAAAPPVASAPPAETPRKETPVAIARPPTLDLGTLENRLKETKAIGIMSKLALKNQIDDLLARFRTAHASGGNVASLRQPYESLLGKVQSLLDGDPKLANDVSASREAIWGVLTDPVKFRSLS